jgi:YHS domain-containing protein
MMMSHISIRLLSLALSAAPAVGFAQHAGHGPIGTDAAQAIQDPADQEPASKTPAATVDEEPSNRGPHGGVIVEQEGLRAEIVVDQTGIKLYLLDRAPIESKGLRATAVLKIAGDPSQRRFDLLPQPSAADGVRLLAARYDLSRYGGQAAELTVEGLRHRSTTRSFPKLVASVELPPTAEQSRATAIADQKVCPVSGEPLGSMGDPVPVTVGDQTIYVCCIGCVAKVKADFAHYFQKLHKTTELIAIPATEADSDAIAKQKTCPVMDEPLGSMGAPLKVTGLGRDVFLCCKGCLKFLREDPEKYLAKLPPLPAPAVTKTSTADAAHVEAQKLCPVMDEPLDAMGGPYRTVVEGRVVYLCCPGCAKRLHADPAQYLEKLASQGVEPPIAKRK